MFIDKCEALPAIASVFHLMTPEQMDGKRDQNSVLLLNKQRWDVAEAVELTDSIVAQLDGSIKNAVAPGDLFALRCKENVSGDAYLLVSFHGDTNGQSSIPVMQAVHSIASSESLKLIVGIDANTYQPGSKVRSPKLAVGCSHSSLHTNHLPCSCRNCCRRRSSPRSVTRPAWPSAGGRPQKSSARLAAPHTTPGRTCSRS